MRSNGDSLNLASKQLVSIRLIAKPFQILAQMDKAARIKQFVDIERINNSIIIKQSTPLFQKLVENVKREYKSFHGSREPKIVSAEIPLKDEKSESVDAGDYSNLQFLSVFSRLKQDYELPFAISQEMHCENAEEREADVIFPSRKLLRTSYFVNSAFTRETFHQIQRQHKIWWMKFGVSPGKYSISDQKSESFYKVS
jgi:hypothetical protein